MEVEQVGVRLMSMRLQAEALLTRRYTSSGIGRPRFRWCKNPSTFGVAVAHERAAFFTDPDSDTPLVDLAGCLCISCLGIDLTAALSPAVLPLVLVLGARQATPSVEVLEGFAVF